MSAAEPRSCLCRYLPTAHWTADLGAPPCCFPSYRLFARSCGHRPNSDAAGMAASHISGVTGASACCTPPAFRNPPTRSPSSASAVHFRAASSRRMRCGNSSPGEATRSSRCRPIAGTSTRSTIRRPGRRARRSLGAPACCATSPRSMPGFSESRRAKRRRWIRSSDCCSKSRGVRLKMRGFRQKAWPAAAPVSTSAFRTATTMGSSSSAGGRSMFTPPPAAHSASWPTGCRTGSTCGGRASRSIPRARRRWWRSMRPARPC